MFQPSHLKSLATVFFLAVILSACGGGGGGGATAPADPVTCEANQYNDNGTCVPLLTVADCQTMGYKAVLNNSCIDPYLPTELGFYKTAEYNNSTILGDINAAEAYVNIAQMIADDDALDTDDDTNTMSAGLIKQGGEGQIVSIWSNMRTNSDSRGYDKAYVGLADTANPVFADGYNTHTGATTDVAVCPDVTCSMDSIGLNHSLNGMAGRRDGTGIHGVAYNAKIKMVILANSTNQDHINAGFQQTHTNSGQDIVAMIYDRKVNYFPEINTGKFYNAPSAGVQDYENNGLKAAVDAGTLIITDAGAHGTNSINGMMTYHAGTDVVAALIADKVGMKESATDAYGSAALANKAQFSDAATDGNYVGKWIVAVGVDASDVIHSSSNACGATKQYCLSVPEIATVANDGSSIAVNPAYTLAGAFAVIKGAYPNLTSTNLVSLALGTADYIPDAEGLVNNETGKYNAVYGHGLLNLEAATSLSEADASDANIITNSLPIGAIWGDTKLTLSSHFGTQLSRVNLGVQDKYGRHFVLDAPQTSYAPIAISLDDYIGNLLGENVQSEKLGGQAQVNYSNNGENNWMNLEYISGKATTKIAFQDSYKINPLSDTGTTTILRANNIRPASSNIGMMDVDYQLGGALTLSSYVARGEYDTGYKFDELATDFDVNYKQSHLNIGIGNIREHGQFLGTNTSGAYALNAPSVSNFTDVTYGHDIGNKFNIYANYINYETDVDMLYDQFASIDGLQADQYQIGFTGKDLISKDDSLNVALITKLGVTNGALNQNSTLGYTADGAYNNVSQSYDLAVNQRHQQFEITYQGKLYQNADKISALRDNRFFTSIRVDQNLNHVQGASQVEIVSGINVRY